MHTLARCLAPCMHACNACNMAMPNRLRALPPCIHAGSAGNRVVPNRLSELLACVEPCLIQAANQLWSGFARQPSTAAAAQTMLFTLGSSTLYQRSQLGSTGWNAYSLNIDYRTARHIDRKNVKGTPASLNPEP